MSITRIEKFQPLQAGQYWCAVADIPEHVIYAGDVLLIELLSFVDDQLHTIHVRNHPSRYGESFRVDGRTVEAATHLFLLDEFSRLFEFEMDAEIIRQAEVAAIQAELTALQGEIFTAQADPNTILIAANIDPDTNRLLTDGVLPNLGAVTEASLVQARAAAHHELHKAQTIAAWFTDKSAAIGETLGKLAPYFSERAAAALASVSETTQAVKHLLQGLETLDLFLLKGVVIETLQTGTSAPPSIPLTIFQRKLYADEELAAWAEVSEEFDYQDEKRFLTALVSQPELQAQIFGGAERAIVCCATRRTHKDYGDVWANQQNEINREVYLLIRDGENLYRVFSPVESHLQSDLLFPSYDLMGKHFTGFDGEEIKLADVRYVKARDRHDNAALHYKRFLILFAGLDQQKKLFGNFYSENERNKFISLAFQAKHFRLISDVTGEKLFPLEKRLSLAEWVRAKNAYLRSGSRVFGLWAEQIDEHTAPACMRRSGGYRSNEPYLAYHPIDPQSLQIAFAVGHQLFVKVRVTGDTHRYHTKSFDAKVQLARSSFTDTFTFLCLDAVTSEELRHYIYNREARSQHLRYIRLFKAALAHLEAENTRAASVIEQLSSAIAKQQLPLNGFASHDELLQTSIRSWRAIHRGQEIAGLSSQESNELLTHCFFLSRSEEYWTDRLSLDAASFLQLSITGKNQILLYTIPHKVDNRLFPQRYADCHKLKLTRKSRVARKILGLRHIFQPTLTETTLLKSERAGDWSVCQPDPLTPTEKAKSLAAMEFSAELLRNQKLSDETVEALFAKIREFEKKHNRRYVQNTSFVIPLAAYCPGSVVRIVAARCSAIPALIRFSTNADTKKRLADWFTRRYSYKPAALAHLSSGMSWTLVSIPPNEQARLGFDDCPLMDKNESPQTYTLRLRPKSDVPSFDEWINAVATEVREQKGEAAFVFAAGCEHMKWDEIFDQKPSRGRFDWDDIRPHETINEYASLVANPAGDLYLCLQHENEAAYQRVIGDIAKVREHHIAAFKSGDNAIFFIRQEAHGRSFQQTTLTTDAVTNFLTGLELLDGKRPM